MTAWSDGLATYEIRCALTGDEAEADSAEAALLAAHTLVDDAFDELPLQGRVRAARRTISILRDGIADVALTRLAQRGQRTMEQAAA